MAIGKDSSSFPEIRSAVDPIFLLGSPRSGTSWLGNILNSHDSTLLRHEPDTIIRGDYPNISDQIYLEEARHHIELLTRVRNLKAVGSRPIFPKAYLSNSAWMARKGMIYAAKVLTHVSSLAERLQIPDLVDLEDVRVVLKSVSALGRSGSFGAAYPGSRFILILRHPCGHVDSIVRGSNRGLMPEKIPLAFLETNIAKDYGLSIEMVQSMKPAAQAAWRWSILNEQALKALPNAKIILYEDLCQSPIEVSKALFEFLDLEWCEQTEAFIEESTSQEGSYFETYRDPLVAAHKWRKTFDEIGDVMRAIGGTVACKLFEDIDRRYMLERDA